jgi:hypothetical protein
MANIPGDNQIGTRDHEIVVTPRALKIDGEIVVSEIGETTSGEFVAEDREIKQAESAEQLKKTIAVIRGEERIDVRQLL